LGRARHDRRRGAPDEVEHWLEREFPGTEILIHLDPEGQVDEPGNPLAETDLTPGRET
jgi:hypothetical protein